MITSLSNERLKAIRKLQDRKARQESGLFFVEGLRIVAEAVEQQAQVETLVVAPDLLVSPFGQKLVDRLTRRGTQVLNVTTEAFQRISLKQGPQGLAAVVRQRWTCLEDVTFAPQDSRDSAVWVALDSVADPGNLGTILRTNDAVGGQGVILLDQSTDPYDPSAVRASMGAVFNQQMIKASLAEFTNWKRRMDVPVVGASGQAKIDYHAYRYPSQTVLLMGSERQGLQDQHLKLCDELVSIPMLGSSDSLNLAVATAVVLYEILNQRREKP